MASLERYAALVAHMGLDLELIGHNGLRERFPWIAGDIAGASSAPATDTPIRALSPQPSPRRRGACGRDRPRTDSGSPCG